MDDLLTTINKLQKDLSVSINSLSKHGKEYAQAERNYRVAKTKKALLLRDENFPATLIDITIKGYEEIADLKLAMDIAKCMYDANHEHLQVTKLQLRILGDQWRQEMGYPQIGYSQKKECV